MIEFSAESAYQVIRILFALSLLWFLVMIVRGTLGDVRVGFHHADGLPGPRRSAELLVVGGEPGSVVPEGAAFPLLGATNIGRAESARIRLEDPSVSAQHAVLRVVDGVWVVEDLGSRNGTLIDGHRVSGSATLRCGSELQFGRVKCRLMC